MLPVRPAAAATGQPLLQNARDIPTPSATSATPVGDIRCSHSPASSAPAAKKKATSPAPSAAATKNKAASPAPSTDAARKKAAVDRGTGRPSPSATLPVSKIHTNRAKWTKEDNKLFYELYCIQIDVGTCKNGVMSKMGWQDIQHRFELATGKLHNSEQFGYRFRELKKLWVFIEQLRHVASGVGNREDGSIVASDKWWDDKFGRDKNKQEFQDLKFGWPEYLDEMDRMFAGVAVTGETAFVPGVSRHLNFVSSGEEDEAVPDSGTIEPEGTPGSFGTHQYFDTPGSSTPASSGSKRSSSSFRSTAKSLGKKPRNTQARQKDANMSLFNSNYVGRTQMIRQLMLAKKSFEEQAWRARQEEIAEQKQKWAAKEEQVNLITQSAEQLGIDDMEGDLWTGVLNICKDDDARNVYLKAGPKGRLQLIKKAAKDNQPPAQAQVEAEVDNEEEPDNWWEVFWNLVVDDEAEEAFWNYGTYQLHGECDQEDVV